MKKIIVNKSDRDYKDYISSVFVGMYPGEFIIYSNNTQETLDILIDFFVENGYTGLYCTYEELRKSGFNESEIDDLFISAGNYSFYIEGTYMVLEERENKLEKVEL